MQIFTLILNSVASTAYGKIWTAGRELIWKVYTIATLKTYASFMGSLDCF